MRETAELVAAMLQTDEAGFVLSVLAAAALLGYMFRPGTRRPR